MRCYLRAYILWHQTNSYLKLIAIYAKEMKHYRVPSYSPIKSKFGCVIFDARELQGWQTTGSTASVSLTRSEMNIYEQFYETFTLIYTHNVNCSQNCLRKFIYLFIRMFMCELRFYPHALVIYAYIFVGSHIYLANQIKAIGISRLRLSVHSTLLVLLTNKLQTG